MKHYKALAWMMATAIAMQTEKIGSKDRAMISCHRIKYIRSGINLGK